MNLTLISSLVAAAAAALATWAFQDARYGAELADLRVQHNNVVQAAAEESRAKERSINKTYQEALNAALLRERKHRADAEHLGRAAERLREQNADAARLLAAAPPATVLEYAAALDDVFNRCVREYRALALASDGHATDARTLVEAWPR